MCRSPVTEPPAAARSGTATARRDVLLATKLHVPGPRPGLVPRPRLAQRLDEGLAQGLVLVCAPAGYGKTVLLADWARQGGRPAGWLALDAADNDPARFWRHVVAALDRAHPGIEERMGPLLGPPVPPTFEPLVTALINELAAQPGDGTVRLILDDYHLIDSRPVHASVGFLLEHRPPGLGVVLGSRIDPALALARLRARGQLAELRASELRFTQDEAAALLQQIAPVPAALPDADVAALAARTEGWAAGLQLAGLSLRGQADVAGFVAAFTGSHRYVLDYLAEEVLERQPGQVRTFLAETSVLDRLSGPLCDAVTGRTGSQALLEQVEHDGLFLMPLDEVRGWWRYHHLFADLLRARLQAGQPGQVAQLHRRAAAWYTEHGQADDALGHAVAAGEMVWAARLIEQHFDTVYMARGEGATIQRWLSALPDDLARSRPRLLLAQGLLAANRGDVEIVERSVDAAGHAPAGGADEPFEPTAGRAASLLVNVAALNALCRSYAAYLRGDAERMAGCASQALAVLGEGESMLELVIRWNLALAEWLRGRLAEAEHAFVAGITGWRAAGQPALTAYGGYQLGQVQRAQGRLDAAGWTYQQVLEFTAVPGQAPLAAAGPAYVGLAEVAYQRNELDVALRQVSEGVALCRQFAYTPPLAAGLVTLAWLRQAAGDPAGGQEAMTGAGQAEPGPAGLLNPVPAQRARLLLAQGDLAAAARWTQEIGLEPDDDPVYPREPGYLVLARVLIAQSRPGPALALLDRLHAAAAAQGRAGSVIEAGALRALALAALGEDTAAVAALAETLTLACPQGYVRVFADEGPPMAALLARLIAAQRSGPAAAGIPLGYLARILRALSSEHSSPERSSAEHSGPGTGPATAAAPGIVEPLTGRELEVLALLATGRSNQAIAGELVVTIDTVKKHVSHIMDKLGAANRTEAVTRARELGLIP